jgi:hypothetical protein
MKILTGSGWIMAFLESVNLDVYEESDFVRVEMTLLFVGKDSTARAVSAMPDWIVHLDDAPMNDGERVLAEAMKKAKADTLEERVAEEMMGILPGGRIRVESVTELKGNEINTVGVLNGEKRLFFKVSGDHRAKVVGHFMGKKA